MVAEVPRGCVLSPGSSSGLRLTLARSCPPHECVQHLLFSAPRAFWDAARICSTCAEGCANVQKCRVKSPEQPSANGGGEPWISVLLPLTGGNFGGSLLTSGRSQQRGASAPPAVILMVNSYMAFPSKSFPSNLIPAS